MRPLRLIVVSGTGTDIGKTWVSCAVLADVRRRGVVVAARKPAESFSRGEDRTDAQRLASATGEPPEIVCRPQRSYPMPMAPPMAASALGLPAPTLAELVEEVRSSWPDHEVGLGLVEGAGGVASPLASDGDTADLVAQLEPDLTIVVADAELGTLNNVRLSVRALGEWPVLVHLNRFDPSNDLHARNLEWLRTNDALQVTSDIPSLALKLCAIDLSD